MHVYNGSQMLLASSYLSAQAIKSSTSHHRPCEVEDWRKPKMTFTPSYTPSYTSRSIGNKMNLIGQPFDQLEVIPATNKR